MNKLRDGVIVFACLVVGVYYSLDLKTRWQYWVHGPEEHLFINTNTNTQQAVQSKSQTHWQTVPPELSPPPDHPPLTIIGGEYSFTIHYTTHEYLRSNDSGAVTILDYGTDVPGFRSLDHTIWMYRGDPNPRATVMHELLHVAKYLGDRQHFQTDDAPGQNHDFISAGAPELLILMRRNPGLVKWLLDDKPIMQE